MLNVLRISHKLFQLGSEASASLTIVRENKLQRRNASPIDGDLPWRWSKTALKAACMAALFLGAIRTHADTYTLDNNSTLTLQNGVVDVIVYPTDVNGNSTLWGGGTMFPDVLSISPIPVVSGFNASEDFIDLRGTLLNSNTVVWDNDYADSQNAPVVGTDPTYTAYRTYGALLGKPYSISGNTLGAGGSPTGQLVGFTDDSSWMPVMVFFMNTVGTITINNFLLPGSALPSSDSTPPSVVSVNVPANGTYRIGQSLDFTVNFDETVAVSTGGGTPRLAVTLETGGTVYAGYVSGNGTAALVFRYTIVSGNLDTDGITLAAALQLNGGTLKDSAGNDATLTLNSVSATTGVKVDGIAPVVTGIIRKTPGAQVINANSVVFQVTFSEPVVNLDSSWFSIASVAGGTVTATVGTPSGGPQVYDVPVTLTGGSGAFRLDVTGNN